MKCVYHDDQEASAICSTCHQPVCEACLVELGGKQFCRPCLEKKVVGKLEAGSGEKSLFWAFVLSLVPGVGYLYLGLMRRGMQTMFIFYGAIFLAVITEFGAIPALVLPVTMFYTIFDTLQLLKQMNEGHCVEDKLLFEMGLLEARGSLIGTGLIILGALALLNNLLPRFFSYHYLMNRYIAPVLIVALGIYILYRNTRGREKQ